MTVEFKRMLQRRGNNADLPQPNTLRDGEIYLVLDTEEMLFVSGGKYVKTLTQSDIVNDATSVDTDKPLSALVGKQLDDRISNINTYWQVYTDNMNIEIAKKQDIILYKGVNPPNNKDLFWQKI